MLMSLVTIPLIPPVSTLCQVYGIASKLGHSDAENTPSSESRTHLRSTASQREGNARAFPIATRLRRRTIPFMQRQNAPKEQARARARASMLNGGTYVHGDSIHRS